MAIFGKWGYKRLGGKKGLTLIELLIVLVILAILAGVIVLAVGGIFGRTGEQAYNLVRDEIQLAVTGYMTNSSHGLPVMAGNNSNVDVCLLLGPDELLRDIPDGVRTESGNCTGTSDTNHYIWVLDDGGNVGSVCVDTATESCDAATDGYQGVWP
ncbi:MAG: type II secretion system protein [Dehalococcoidia bacterium]|nr:type II secretion system protein [Dehalococcoidia bacterium]